MLERLILWILLHGLACWILFYVRDLPSLNTPEKLTMPKISDLHENRTIYEIQEYIDRIILPSHDYFKLLKKSEEMCTNENKGGAFFLPVLTATLMTKNVISYKIDVWIKILICSVLIVGIAVLLYFIYHARKWKTLRRIVFDETKCNGYSYCYDFKYQGYTYRNTDLRFAKNNSLINDHHRFLLIIEKKLQNRHNIAIVVNVLGYLALIIALNVIAGKL